MTLCTLPKTEPAGRASQLTALQPTVDDGARNIFKSPGLDKVSAFSYEP